MSDDDPSAIRRAHRAKRLGSLDPGIDGGAVAVGLVLPLAAMAPTLVLEMPGWVAIGSLGIGLFIGGFLSRSLVSAGSRCPRCHGAYVGMVAVIVLYLVIAADVVATSETVSLEFRTIIAGEVTRAAIAALLMIGVAGSGGLMASSREE